MGYKKALAASPCYIGLHKLSIQPLLPGTLDTIISANTSKPPNTSKPTCMGSYLVTPPRTSPPSMNTRSKAKQQHPTAPQSASLQLCTHPTYHPDNAYVAYVPSGVSPISSKQLKAVLQEHGPLKYFHRTDAVDGCVAIYWDDEDLERATQTGRMQVNYAGEIKGCPIVRRKANKFVWGESTGPRLKKKSTEL
jgi:hypothetical protein